MAVLLEFLKAKVGSHTASSKGSLLNSHGSLKRTWLPMLFVQISKVFPGYQEDAPFTGEDGAHQPAGCLPSLSH